MMLEQGQSSIIGIAELPPTLDPGGRTTLDLLAEAAAQAIQDAGLHKSDIDGLLVAPPSEDSYFLWPSQVAEYLQLAPVFMNMVELGGASAAGFGTHRCSTPGPVSWRSCPRRKSIMNSPMAPWVLILAMP